MGFFHAALCGVKLPQSSKTEQGLEDLILKMELLVPNMDQIKEPERSGNFGHV